MEMLKFALIGTGNIAGTYVNACKNVEEAEITCVISRDPIRAQKAAENYNIPCAAVNLAHADADFQAVMLATPQGVHHISCVEAAQTGKHVLTEKPINISTENTRLMIEACKNAGVKLGVSYQYRTKADCQSLHSLLAKKAFGKIYAVNLSLGFYRGQDYFDNTDWRGTLKIDGGGCFLQQGSHNIDILYWFFGMPTKIFAKTGTFAHTDIEVEDHGSAILEFSDKSMATITASTIAKPGFSPRMEVFTEKGTFVTENDCITLWEINDIPNPAVKKDPSLHNPATSAAVNDTSGHEAIIRDFVKAVQEDREPMITGEEAAKSVEIILKIYESAATGKEICVRG
jgi:predicted dehydrogenase